MLLSRQVNYNPVSVGKSTYSTVLPAANLIIFPSLVGSVVVLNIYSNELIFES